MAEEKTQSASQAFVSIGEKISMLLEKTRESIIADVKKDAKNIVFFTGDADAVNKLGMIGNTRQIIDFIDLIFTKMGIDFSDADNLQKFGKRLNQTIDQIQGLAEIIQKTADAVKSDTDGSNAEDNAAEFFIKFVPLLQQLVGTIKDFSDTEIEKIAGELDDRFQSIDVKAVVKRIVNYTVMTLLRNAKEVFAAEIEFVELKAQLAKNTIEALKNDIQKEISAAEEEIKAGIKQVKGDMAKAKKQTTDAFKQIYKTIDEFDLNVDSMMSDINADAKKRAAELCLELNICKNSGEDRINQLFDENADVFAEVARAFSIAYSILDFFGIIQHKKFTITIPNDIIKAMRDAKTSVAGLLGNADKKFVSIASGVNREIKAFGDDLDNNIQGAATIAAGTVRKGYDKAVAELKNAAIDVDGKATAITNDHINRANSVRHELSEVSSMLGISQASIQTVQLQLATMAVTKLEGSLKNGGVAIKKEITDVKNAYDSIKTAIDNLYSGKVSNVQAEYNKITSAAKQLGEKTDKVIDNLDNFSYTVDYITIDWSKTKTLFTHPVKHFKALYAIDSIDDAKALASRIMDILHLINPNIPTFDNLLNMLETLLKKLKSRLMNLVNEWKREAKGAVKDAIKMLRPLIDRIQAVIDFLKGLATQLKGEMTQVIENLRLVMNTVGKNIETVANCYYRQLVAIKNGAEDKIENAVQQAENELTAVKGRVEDTAGAIEQKINEAKSEAKSAYNAAKAELEARYKHLTDEVVRELKADANKLREQLNTIKSVQLDLDEELLRIIIDTPIQVPSLKGFDLDTSVIKPALAGFLEVDIDTDLNVESLGKDAEGIANNCFDGIRKNVTDTFSTIAEKSRSLIANWAEAVGTSMMTVANQAIWKERLDTVMTQLEVEFNGDMSTLKNLVTVDGAKSMVTDFGAVKANLAENLDINSYINIVKTAVNDVVLPNPELYFASFKDVVKEILEFIKTHLETLVNKISKQLGSLKGAAQKRAQDIHDSLKSTLKNLEDAFNAKVAQGKQLCELLKKMIDDMATQMWRRIKSELINPLINSLKAYITSVVRQVIRLAVERIVEKIMAEVFPVVRNLADQVANAGQNASIATRSLLRDAKSVANTVVNTAKDAAHEKVRSAINDAINQLPSPSAKLVDAYNRAKALTMATYDFAMSDKSVPDIVALVKAIFNSISDDAKKEFSDLLPSIPDSLTDFCKNMEYEADINNMFACVTLFDLSKLKPNEGGNVSVDCKLHMLMQVEDYEINTDKTTKALAFRFMLSGGAGVSFKLGENNELKISGSGGVKNVGFALTEDVEGCGRVHGIFDGKTAAPGENFNVLAFIQFERIAETPALWLTTEYLDIKAKNYPIIVYVGYNPFNGEDKYAIPRDMLNRLGIDPDAESSKGFQAGFLAALEEVELVLKLRNNKMLANFIDDDISLSVSVYVGYDKNVGLRIGGGAKFHISFDLQNKKLGPLHLSSFDIDAGSLGFNFGSLGLNINSNFAVDFGAISLSFKDLGLGFDCSFFDPISFDLMKPDFGVHFNWPTGIGIAIDVPAVKGSGMLSINADEGTFMGVLELKVIDKFGVAGYVLCDTGAKPGHFFSLATMISASFSPGIPLGMGFSLTAIGGALGINRKLDRKAITDGVRQGTLESVFFVQDIKNHLSEIEKNAQKFFPAKKKQFYLGLLGQISFEPVVKCNFGLMLQMPDPTEIIIVGALKVSAGEASDKVLCINVYFAGGINFEEGIWFDASIVDSKILLLDLSGDMAFRLFWGGAAKGFLMTIGGFHPAYKPEEAMMVSNLKRLSIGLNYGIVKMSLDTYLAITSNTFQIGADFKLLVGWKKFGLMGYFGFDALFQFRPFMFMFSARAGVAVMLGSCKLMSISLSFDASGPRPWDIKGKARFKILFITFPVKFHLTWGKEQVYLPEAEVLSFALLLDQANNSSNWISRTTQADDDVMLSHDDDQPNTSGGEQPMVIQPYTSISFNQSIIPFKTINPAATEKLSVAEFDTMDICNDARPVDYNSFELAKVWCGDKSNSSNTNNAEYQFACNDFAPSLYKGMTPSEKLKSPSYERYYSGFTVAVKECEQNNTTPLNVTVNHILGDFQPESAYIRPEYKASANGTNRFTESQFSPKAKTDTKRYVDSLNERMSELPKKPFYEKVISTMKATDNYVSMEVENIDNFATISKGSMLEIVGFGKAFKAEFDRARLIEALKKYYVTVKPVSNFSASDITPGMVISTPNYVKSHDVFTVTVDMFMTAGNVKNNSTVEVLMNRERNRAKIYLDEKQLGSGSVGKFTLALSEPVLCHLNQILYIYLNNTILFRGKISAFCEQVPLSTTVKADDPEEAVAKTHATKLCSDLREFCSKFITLRHQSTRLTGAILPHLCRFQSDVLSRLLEMPVYEWFSLLFSTDAKFNKLVKELSIPVLKPTSNGALPSEESLRHADGICAVLNGLANHSFMKDYNSLMTVNEVAYVAGKGLFVVGEMKLGAFQAGDTVTIAKSNTNIITTAVVTSVAQGRSIPEGANNETPGKVIVGRPVLKPGKRFPARTQIEDRLLKKTVTQELKSFAGKIDASTISNRLDIAMKKKIVTLQFGDLNNSAVRAGVIVFTQKRPKRVLFPGKFRE